MAGPFDVYLLDVGPEEYGDAVLCRFGAETVLIDGAHPGNYVDKGEDHPSLDHQIGAKLELGETPYPISLLIVSHAHADHIGCLPRLVADNKIAPEWALVPDPGLGWGRPADAPPEDADQPPAVRQLAALLREETITREEDDAVAAFAADAATLEQTYTKMLNTLEQRGTQVVRYGPDNPAELLRRFANIGLQIVGPTVEQLAHCADLIHRRSQDLLQLASAKLGDAADDTSQVVPAYRNIVAAIQSDAAAADAFSKDKGAVNDQSIVTTFLVNGKKLLFTGDMQLAQPEVSDNFIVQSIAELNDALGAGAPYALVKLSHHGSYNGFTEELWEKWGKPGVLGICAGSGSTAHPNPQTLDVLKEHTDQIQWARTDHNGLSTFEFDDGEARISVTRGKPNDPVPNATDLPKAPAAEGEVPATELQAGVQVATVPAGGAVEIRVPAGVRISLNLEVQAAAAAPTLPAAAVPAMTPAEHQLSELAGRPERVVIANDRVLPTLAFITDKTKLAANIGVAESNAVIARLKASGHVVIEQLPQPLLPLRLPQLFPRAAAVIQQVRGVVLLGGYDVVPPLRIDALPANLRQSLPAGSDADDFYVWSDDGYGDLTRLGLKALPVSRIPDGKSSKLVFAALAAGPCHSPEPRRGIRNLRRPFAEPIYTTLPGTAAMLVSEPTTTGSTYSLDGERIYIMLHGDYTDGTLYWGETNAGGYPAAVDQAHVPQRPGVVVFTGCCWGALAANTRAVDYQAGKPIAPRTAASSIALRFLANGARAFLGCTGTHYSPVVAPYNYFGGPMHSAFWAALQAGAPPALALFRAKAAYRQGMPHNQQAGSVGEAIEWKILREYTCLGLGW